MAGNFLGLESRGTDISFGICGGIWLLLCGKLSNDVVLCIWWISGSLWVTVSCDLGR